MKRWKNFGQRGANKDFGCKRRLFVTEDARLLAASDLS